MTTSSKAALVSLRARWFLLFLFLLNGISNAHSADDLTVGTDELVNKLTTAYLFNMARFVNWPGDNQTVVLCVNARPDLVNLIQSLDGRVLADNRSLTVDSLPFSTPCSIYYSDDGEFLTRDSLEGPYISQQTLTISNGNQALSAGFTVALFQSNGKMKFSVNRAHLPQREFRMSSKLLRLARRVAP